MKRKPKRKQKDTTNWKAEYRDVCRCLAETQAKLDAARMSVRELEVELARERDPIAAAKDGECIALPSTFTASDSIRINFVSSTTAPFMSFTSYPPPTVDYTKTPMFTC